MTRMVALLLGIVFLVSVPSVLRASCGSEATCDPLAAPTCPADQLCDASSCACTPRLANGYFESGDLTDWTPIGDAFVDSGGNGVPPMERLYQGGISTGEGSVSASDLAVFAGIPSGQLGIDNAVEGSGLRATVSAQAGQAIVFEWAFLTNEPSNGRFDDFAFVTINGVLTVLTDANGVALPLGNSSYGLWSGPRPFYYVVSSTGSYTITVGVVDVLDNLADSALLLDKVGVCSDPSCLIAANSCGNGAIDIGEQCETAANCGPNQQCETCQCVTPSTTTTSTTVTSTTTTTPTTLPGGGSTTTLPGAGSTTTTTMPCTSIRCILDAALQSPECAGQPIPASAVAKFKTAESLLDQAAAAQGRHARKLVRRAKQYFVKAEKKVTRAAHGKNAKLALNCAQAIGGAVSGVVAGLGV